MNHTQYYQEQQEAKRLHDRIFSFLDDFKVGTLAIGSGIRKLRGAKPKAGITNIFSLPFVGANFSRGIVNNTELAFGKDAAYEFLENSRYNWREFLDQGSTSFYTKIITVTIISFNNILI